MLYFPVYNYYFWQVARYREVWRLAVTKEDKTGLIEKFRKHGKDTGSPEVQIALLTTRINNLNDRDRGRRDDRRDDRRDRNR